MWEEIRHAETFSQSSLIQQQAAAAITTRANRSPSISNTELHEHKSRVPQPFISLCCMSGTLKQKKIMDGAGRLVSTFPEGITNAWPRDSPRASLKDMTVPI